MTASPTGESHTARNRPLDPVERRRVAFHEAGHTVMVLDIGSPEARLDWVGILPCRKIARAKGPRRRGTTRWFRRHRLNPEPCHALHDALTQMIVCAAGEAAVAHLEGRRSFQVDGTDAEAFLQAARTVCQGDLAETRAFKAWVMRRTMSRVRARWTEIQAVAHRLIERSELNAEEASECVRGLFDSPAVAATPVVPVADSTKPPLDR